MGLMQLTRLVQVDCPLGPDVLLLQRMEGREELGRLFAYELHLVSENPNLPLEQLLGKPMSLSLELPGGSRRFFHGIVARCSQVAGHGQFAGYQATLRPWPWLLTRTSDCRIFQNQSVPEIIKQVFRDLGFSDFEDALTRPYREWEYCVQYRETSFDFISRLMEQEGIYYWFRHEQKRHILVLSDAYGAHRSPGGYASVPYYPPTLGHRERDHFFDWQMAREVQPGSLTLNDYDFQRPGARLEVRSNIARPHAAADYPLYDYPGEYVQSQDGEQYARNRIEAIQAQHERVRLRGVVRGIGAGHLFRLSGYPRDDQNREYLVVGAEYQVVQELYETGSGGAGSQFEASWTASTPASRSVSCRRLRYRWCGVRRPRWWSDPRARRSGPTSTAGSRCTSTGIATTSRTRTAPAGFACPRPGPGRTGVRCRSRGSARK